MEGTSPAVKFGSGQTWPFLKMPFICVAFFAGQKSGLEALCVLLSANHHLLTTDNVISLLWRQRSVCMLPAGQKRAPDLIPAVVSHHVVAGVELRTSGRAARVLSLGAISPAPGNMVSCMLFTVFYMTKQKTLLSCSLFPKAELF